MVEQVSKKMVAALAFSGALTWGGCTWGGPDPQPHPTHGGPNGRCIEADGAPCDDDTFDLDDAFEKKKTKAPTPYPLRKTPGPRVTSKVRR